MSHLRCRPSQPSGLRGQSGQPLTRLLLLAGLLLSCANTTVTYAQAESAESASTAEQPGSGELEPDRRAVELALDGSYAVSGSSGLDLGGGGALRLGYAFPFKWVALVPEAGADVFAFSAAAGSPSATQYGAFGGGRLRVGRGIEPGISAHAGIAGVHWGNSFAAPTADVGLFVELTYFRRLILGAQGEFKSTFAVGDHPALTWYTFGLTVGTRL